LRYAQYCSLKVGLVGSAALFAMSKLVAALARCLLSEPSVEGVRTRATHLLGRNWHWFGRLAQRYFEAFAQTRPAPGRVEAFLRADAGLANARRKLGAHLRIAHWIGESPRMHPVAAAGTWQLPNIESPAALADWLCLSLPELDWFADMKGLCSKHPSTRLRHYHYRVLTKSSGGLRLIEAPKRDLKAIQRRILSEIVDRIPAHPAVHGFVRGRSIRTFAAPHTGQRVILRMDLRDFFPSFRAARIQAMFRTVGYPGPVAALLAGICTTDAPSGIWTGRQENAGLLREARLLYGRAHLPQGAPASPALANVCSRRLDVRLAGLAEAAGAVYTRYADDLAFSGGETFERPIERFAVHAAAIAREEGFAVNHRKTRIMRQGVRQRLAGLVTNEHANVARTDFDALKATLHNCVRLGAESQNRTAHPRFRAHLDGRIGWVEWVNPAKGQRLRAIFQRINWQ
jgi:RNA-directed DNA polymerase